MSFYGNLAATTLRLLTTYGQTVVCTRTTGATFDPGAGTYSGGSTTTITGKGVVVPWDQNEVEQVQQDDIKIIFEASSTAPEINDKCTVNSVVYQVVKVSPLDPAGTPLIYTLQVRL